MMIGCGQQVFRRAGKGAKPVWPFADNVVHERDLLIPGGRWTGFDPAGPSPSWTGSCANSAQPCSGPNGELASGRQLCPDSSVGRWRNSGWRFTRRRSWEFPLAACHRRHRDRFGTPGRRGTCAGLSGDAGRRHFRRTGARSRHSARGDHRDISRRPHLVAHSRDAVPPHPGRTALRLGALLLFLAAIR